MNADNEIVKIYQPDTSIAKPVQAVENLIALFLPHANKVDTQLDVNDLMNPAKYDDKLPVVLLLSGEIVVYRKAGDLLFAWPNAPYLFGLEGSHFRYETYRLKATKGSEVFILGREEAIDLVQHHDGALRDLLEHQTWLYDIMSSRDNLLINKNSYQIVCGLLLELYQYPLEKRLKMSVANYILDRSNLARSGVMKILAALRVGEFVDIQRGKLIKVLKKFPSDY